MGQQLVMVIHERSTIFLASTYLHEDDMAICRSIYFLFSGKLRGLYHVTDINTSPHADGSRGEGNRRVRRPFEVGSLQRGDGS
jgi:hypothetical protein